MPESGVTITVVFSEDTDGDYVTTADTELFLYSNQEVTRLTDNTWADTKPVYQDGVLYWYSQDGIQYSSDFGQTVEEISLTNNNSDDFWVISSPDGTAAILYAVSYTHLDVDKRQL